MDKEMLDALEVEIAARELAFLFKCEGEDVVGGHEPIMHSGCCPLCTEIGDYNELQAELAELRAMKMIYLYGGHNPFGKIDESITLGEAIDAAKGKVGK